MTPHPAPPAVEEYLASLAGERGDAVRTVFETVSAAMPEGYELGDYRGAPQWSVPLSRYPVTYNRQPLAYAALIAQKNYASLYLMCLYSDSAEDAAFRAAWAATGLRLDMGKSCLRFRRLDDLDLGLISDAVASTSVDRFIEIYEESRRA